MYRYSSRLKCYLDIIAHGPLSKDQNYVHARTLTYW